WFGGAHHPEPRHRRLSADWRRGRSFRIAEAVQPTCASCRVERGGAMAAADAGSYPVLLPEFQARHAPGRDLYGEGWPGNARATIPSTRNHLQAAPGDSVLPRRPSKTDVSGVQYPPFV